MNLSESKLKTSDNQFNQFLRPPFRNNSKLTQRLSTAESTPTQRNSRRVPTFVFTVAIKADTKYAEARGNRLVVTLRDGRCNEEGKCLQ